MCGICGVFDFLGNRSREQLHAQVQKMVLALRHRGPDATGTYQDDGLVLGATRLSIIDLSDAANQPISDETGEYTLVFNGEIYNYLELRQQMQKKGVVFRTQSDSEVLLRLFIQKKWQCLEDLRGMFAFAVWQKSARRLFLARDRMGEKPLAYYRHNGVLIFASEIRGILALDDIDKTIDPAGLHLGFHYVLPPAPFSAFKHIRKIAPGTCITVSDQAFEQRRYFLPGARSPGPRTESEAADRLRTQMDETVKLLCRSDVAVGATLSGGMDSGAVVASMARTLDTFDAFYIGSKEVGWDVEQLGARKVAKQYGVKLHEMYVGPEMIDNLRDIVKAYAEPFTSFVPLHAHALASSMKGIATVVLTGNGGDELFGGYPEHFRLLKYLKKISIWNTIAKIGLDRALKYIPLKAIAASKEKYAEFCLIPPDRLAANLIFRPRKDTFPHYYSRQMAELTARIDPGNMMAEVYEACGAENLLDGFSCQQLALLSQHSMTSIPDISGMSHSLEFRAPFLDIEMVSMAASLSWSLKMKKTHEEAGGKWILRKAMEKRLPEHVTRLSKFGFGASIPYPKWFLGPWMPFIMDTLASRTLTDCGLFDHAAIFEALDMAAVGRKIFLEPLWSLVTLAIWLEEYA